MYAGVRYGVASSVLLGIVLLGACVAWADEFTSNSFRVLDPVMTPSGFATSTSFQLWSNLSEVAVGTSTATSFSLGGGFLRYPFASTPSVSATGGAAQVALSWGASSGYGGWTASGYSVGQSTTSGGPYSYSSVGAVTSSTRTGLSNGTTYYFVIVVKDSFGTFIATSTEVSAAPASSGGNNNSGGAGGGGGGGGGGGSGPISSAPVVNTGASAVFAGRAYPKSTITLLKDAQVAATTVAGADAKFEISLSGLSAGNYVFSIYGEDKDGNRSSLLSFPVSVTVGANTSVSGIFIAPSIAADKSEVKRGDNITFFGQSSPQSTIVIAVNSEEELFANAQSDTSGAYLLNFDTSVLEMGDHSAKSKASVSGEISSFSKAVAFKVGTKNVAAVEEKKEQKSVNDLNGDNRINLVDFSILVYWYQRPLTGAGVKVDINRDGKVNLVDFSILASHWTG